MQVVRYTWAIILLTLMVSCGPNILPERKFTELYVDHLSKSYPDVKFEIVNDLTVKADYNGKEFSHYLDNAFKEYKMEPDSLDEVIKRYVASSRDLYKEPTPVNIDQIVPIVKPIEYLEDLRQLSKENGEEKDPWVVYEDYNSELIIVYGENTETSIRYFTQKDFNKMTIQKDSLLALAVKNLKNLLPDIQSKGDNGTYMVTAGGDFEASLILLTSIWTNDNFKVKGDIVIAIPNRDMLMITGSNDEQGIKTVKDITDDSYKNGYHQISPFLYKWNGLKFEMWK